MAPRICLGAVSDWYIGVNTDKAPTPKPPPSLPIASWTHEFMVAIWITTPTTKTMFHTMIDFFLPKASAIGPAAMAPIKVPIES